MFENERFKLPHKTIMVNIYSYCRISFIELAIQVDKTIELRVFQKNEYIFSFIPSYEWRGNNFKKDHYINTYLFDCNKENKMEIILAVDYIFSYFMVLSSHSCNDHFFFRENFAKVKKIITKFMDDFNLPISNKQNKFGSINKYLAEIMHSHQDENTEKNELIFSDFFYGHITEDIYINIHLLLPAHLLILRVICFTRYILLIILVLFLIMNFSMFQVSIYF